jgi:hypothetical protein
VRNDRPKFTPSQPPTPEGPVGTGASGGAAQPAAAPMLAGYDKEGFTTDLSLNQGQDTVVGSLGGNALLVVLRFTVDATVN